MATSVQLLLYTASTTANLPPVLPDSVVAATMHSGDPVGVLPPGELGDSSALPLPSGDDGVCLLLGKHVGLVGPSLHTASSTAFLPKVLPESLVAATVCNVAGDGVVDLPPSNL